MYQIIEDQNNEKDKSNDKKSITLNTGKYTVSVLFSSEKGGVDRLYTFRELIISEMAKQIIDVYNKNHRSETEETICL